MKLKNERAREAHPVAESWFLPGAEVDYSEALDWYRERSLQVAAGFEAAVEVALQRIEKTPDAYLISGNHHRYYNSFQPRTGLLAPPRIKRARPSQAGACQMRSLVSASLT